MLAHLDLNSGHVHPVNVPGIPLPCRIAVLLRLMEQTNRNASLGRLDCRIGVSRIGYAIHDDVDLLGLRVHVRLRAIEEILAAVSGWRKIELGMNRGNWILA